MKNFNFFGQTSDGRNASTHRSMKIWYLISIILLLATFCMITIIEIKQIWSFFETRNQYDILWQYVNEQNAFIEKKKRLDKKYQELDNKYKIINTVDSLPNLILINISHLIPNDIKLTELNYQNHKNLCLKGQAKSVNDLTTFIKALSSCEQFIKTKLINTQKDSSNYFTYEIQIDLK